MRRGRGNFIAAARARRHTNWVATATDAHTVSSSADNNVIMAAGTPQTFAAQPTLTRIRGNLSILPALSDLETDPADFVLAAMIVVRQVGITSANVHGLGPPVTLSDEQVLWTGMASWRHGIAAGTTDTDLAVVEAGRIFEVDIRAQRRIQDNQEVALVLTALAGTFRADWHFRFLIKE